MRLQRGRGVVPMCATPRAKRSQPGLLRVLPEAVWASRVRRASEIAATGAVRPLVGAEVSAYPCTSGGPRTARTGRRPRSPGDAAVQDGPCDMAGARGRK